MSQLPWSSQREARIKAREAALDPDNRLDPAERRHRAEELDAAYIHELGKKSGEVRRERARRLRLLEQAAIEQIIERAVAS